MDSIGAYHILDENVNITSFLFRNIRRRYCMEKLKKMYEKYQIHYVNTKT